MSSSEEQIDVIVDKLNQKCPAFHHGCPFVKKEFFHGLSQSQVVGSCPAFKSGCPFSNVKGEEELKQKLSEIPEGHRMCPAFTSNLSKLVDKDSGCPNGSLLIEFIHQIRKDLFIQPENPEEVPLSNQMLEGTLDVHAKAERCKFIKDLIKGKLSKEVYGKFLGCLYYVYQAMEEESLKLKSHPDVSLIHFPTQVNRLEPLIRDLEYFLGPNWKEKIVLTEATKNYVDDIKNRAAHKPKTFVAHAFTRYLGDMFGGQVLASRLKRNFTLMDEEGTAFYRFENIGDIADFREFYLDRLNAIRASQQEKDELVLACRRVFELNIDIFEEFETELGLVTEVKPQLKQPQSSSRLAMKRNPNRPVVALDVLESHPKNETHLVQPQSYRQIFREKFAGPMIILITLLWAFYHFYLKG